MAGDETKPAARHRAEARAGRPASEIRAAVLTISDSRTAEDDRSGDAISQLLREAGHAIAARDLVPDEPDRIEAALGDWIADESVHVIITTGGTGIARRDNTIPVVRRTLSLELEGFGELFRMLSFEEIGSAAMLSRSVGGLVSKPDSEGGDTFLFALPGSTNAVTLAMTRLIIPELPHLIWQRASPSRSGPD